MSKRDAAIVKQKCPAQFLASGTTCQRDRRGFLAAPKGLCEVGNHCCNPSGHPLGSAYPAGLSLCWLGAFPAPAPLLGRGSAVPSGQGAEAAPGLGPRFPLDSWKCYRSQKGPPAIRRVCVSINTMYYRACRNSLHLTRGGAVLNCERWLRKK